jgi:hypothetical protein
VKLARQTLALAATVTPGPAYIYNRLVERKSVLGMGSIRDSGHMLIQQVHPLGNNLHSASLIADHDVPAIHELLQQRKELVQIHHQQRHMNSALSNKA